MIAVNHKDLHEQAILQNAARNAAENHRLWYVALTRASHRVYAMLQDQSGQADSGLAFWRGQGEAVFQHALSLLEPPLASEPPRIVAKQTEAPLQMQAHPLPGDSSIRGPKPVLLHCHSISRIRQYCRMIWSSLLNAQTVPQMK